MKNSNTITLRNEWRELNLKIAQHQKTIKQNTSAGQMFSEEYLNWVNELTERRDYLTNKI